MDEDLVVISSEPAQDSDGITVIIEGPDPEIVTDHRGKKFALRAAQRMGIGRPAIFGRLPGPYPVQIKNKAGAGKQAEQQKKYRYRADYTLQAAI